MAKGKRAKKFSKERSESGLELLLKFISDKRMQYIDDARPGTSANYSANYNPEIQTSYILCNTPSKIYAFAVEKPKSSGINTFGLLTRVFGYHNNNNRILDPTHPYVRFYLFRHEYIMVHLNVRNYEKLVHDLQRKFTCFGMTVREIYKQEQFRGARKIVIYDYGYNPRTDISLPKVQERNLTKAVDNIFKEKYVEDAVNDVFAEKQMADAVNDVLKGKTLEKDYKKQKELVLN